MIGALILSKAKLFRLSDIGQRERERLLRGQVFVQEAVRFKGNLCNCSQLRVSTTGGNPKINSTWSDSTEGGTLSFQIFFLSFSLLTGLQLSIWHCCKPFFSLLYNCQLLCFWRLALSTVVEVNSIYVLVLSLRKYHENYGLQ